MRSWSGSHCSCSHLSPQRLGSRSIIVALNCKTNYVVDSKLWYVGAIGVGLGFRKVELTARLSQASKLQVQGWLDAHLFVGWKPGRCTLADAFSFPFLSFSVIWENLCLSRCLVGMLSGVRYALTGELRPSRGVPPGPRTFFSTPKSRVFREQRLAEIPADSSSTKTMCDSIHEPVVDADEHILRDGALGHDRLKCILTM